jgi:hypothetical protein
MEIKISKKVWIVIIIISSIVAISLIYNVGKVRGFIEGIGFTANKLNSSVCEVINKTRDNNGYCILNSGQRYEMIKECWYENFIVEGEQEFPTYLEVAYFPQRILYYPFIGCW